MSEISAAKMVHTACKAIDAAAVRKMLAAAMSNVCETMAAEMPSREVPASEMCETLTSEVATPKMTTSKMTTSKMATATKVLSAAVPPSASRVRRNGTG
jgi:hypothetical protein